MLADVRLEVLVVVFLVLVHEFEEGAAEPVFREEQTIGDMEGLPGSRKL